MKGNPRCPDCHGAGGQMLAGSWRKCECVRMTSAKREAQRQQSIEDRAAFDRILKQWRKQEDDR